MLGGKHGRTGKRSTIGTSTRMCDSGAVFQGDMLFLSRCWMLDFGPGLLSNSAGLDSPLILFLELGATPKSNQYCLKIGVQTLTNDLEIIV